MLRKGHEVRLLTPYDPDDRLARVAHRGVSPQRPLPDHAISLGRTFGLPINGAVSNLSVSTAALSVIGHELRTGGYDVAHVHEPNAPFISWFATETSGVPTVGTFHTYSTSRVIGGITANSWAPPALSKLAARIAVSEAAAWTARRFYGGRYEIVPNGVDLSAARPEPRPAGEDLEILFVGRAEGRKGLPVLLRAFEALRARAGAPGSRSRACRRSRWSRCCSTRRGALVGPVDEDRKWRLLGSADLLCAPSLGGESFGMVLTEAFASGTPAVASDIAGYRDVVRHGRDGILVPAGEAVELGEALRSLAADPGLRAGMGAAARERAERFAWPRVTAEVTQVYERAVELPCPSAEWPARRAAHGLTPAEPGPRTRPESCRRSSPSSRRAAGAARPASPGVRWWAPAPWPASA